MDIGTALQYTLIIPAMLATMFLLSIFCTRTVVRAFTDEASGLLDRAPSAIAGFMGAMVLLYLSLVSLVFTFGGGWRIGVPMLLTIALGRFTAMRLHDKLDLVTH